MDPADGNKGDMESIQKLKAAYDTLKKEMHRVIVGQERVLDELLTCILNPTSTTVWSSILPRFTNSCRGRKPRATGRTFLLGSMSGRRSASNCGRRGW